MGGFRGYRSPPPSAPVGPRVWWFPLPDPEVRLSYFDYDLLGPVPFQYEVYRGLADDEYSEDFISFGFQSRLIIATIRDAPAFIIFTYDGETEQPARRFDLGFARLEAARGFKIRNVEPGIPSRYQIIPQR